jgi:hypothetical protein
MVGQSPGSFLDHLLSNAIAEEENNACKLEIFGKFLSKSAICETFMYDVVFM